MIVQFVDTNVLLYAISTDPAERAKAERANVILRGRRLGLSVQVLQEFYVQATRPTRADRLSARQAGDLVTSFTRFAVQDTTVGLVQAAIAAQERFGLSYWDAAILEAGRMLGCSEVLSEDLNHSQDYDGIVVVNPFA